jgi:hypothetical protein
MSSTNRSNARDTHISDYYVTPRDCIRNFLGNWLEDLQSNLKDDILMVGERPDRAYWLDPCAGGDEKHCMSYPDVIKSEFDPNVLTTMDIRENSPAEIKGDYLLTEIEKNYYDVIITNPPFNIAREIIEKALEDVKVGGYVVMLLRLNFFGSKQRFDFWEKQLPVWAYVHHRRMSFTDDNKTDSIEYMHAVWQKGNKPKYTMLKII